MEAKKSPGANLENKRGLFYQIGLAASLLIMIGVFASSRTEKSIDFSLRDTAPVIPADLPELVREKEPEAGPVKPVVVNPQDLRIVPNDSRINVEIDWIDDFLTDIPMPVVESVPEAGSSVNEPPFIIAEDMPQFQGGNLSTFRNWVLSNLAYPNIARQNGIEGKVTLTFVIEKDGTLSNIEVLTSPDRSLSDEAVRVLESSPQWTPGKQRNTPVRVRFTLPLEFKLQ